MTSRRRPRGARRKLLYGEPDLTLKVVRDLFTEDFTKMVVQGHDAWETVQTYVMHVAPDLEDRLERYHAASTTAATSSRRTAWTSRSTRGWTARSGCPPAAPSSSTAPRR